MQNKSASLLLFFVKMLFSRYIWFIFIPLFIGFFTLADRLQVRTYKAMYDQRSSVEQIWGDNLAQPMPSVRYKHVGSDVSSLSKGAIHASNISVNLTLDYRQKGLAYYTGYNIDFLGKYTIRNPEQEKVYLSFIFPHPGEGVLQNVKLLVNDKEDVNDTEYQPTLALWTGLLEPTESLEITVQYKSRGLNQFEYGFEPGRQINNFALEITVNGAKNLDYVESTMPPTEPLRELPDGKILTWKLDRALTQFNIGVILPDKLNVEQQLAVMTYRAPAFFLLFLVSLLVIFTLGSNAPNFIQIAIISVTYFMFYPLFAYLLVYIDLLLAFVLAFSVIGLLIFNYVRTLYNMKVASAVIVGYIFYLGLTSIAALLPTYTGLILTIEGVILIGIIMQVLARFKDLELSELIGYSRTPTTSPSSDTQQGTTP